MVALAPRDQIAALRLAALDEILARQLERRLDRLRSAADEEDVVEPRRRVRDEVVGELLGGLRGEEARVRVFELCRAARASPRSRRDASARGTTPLRRPRRRYSPCRSHRG